MMNHCFLLKMKILFFILSCFCCSRQFVKSFSLTPATTPEKIIELQLQALQHKNMDGVFEFASPMNKANVGNDPEKFAQMVESGPYKFLVGHTKSTVLLASRIANSMQYLVRVQPTSEDYPNKSMVEYWWSLSRVQTPGNPNQGCYMVDAVIPNI